MRIRPLKFPSTTFNNRLIKRGRLPAFPACYFSPCQHSSRLSSPGSSTSSLPFRILSTVQADLFENSRWMWSYLPYRVSWCHPGQGQGQPTQDRAVGSEVGRTDGGCISAVSTLCRSGSYNLLRTTRGSLELFQMPCSCPPCIVSILVSCGQHRVGCIFVTCMQKIYIFWTDSIENVWLKMSDWKCLRRTRFKTVPIVI